MKNFCKIFAKFAKNFWLWQVIPPLALPSHTAAKNLQNCKFCNFAISLDPCGLAAYTNWPFRANLFRRPSNRSKIRRILIFDRGRVLFRHFWPFRAKNGPWRQSVARDTPKNGLRRPAALRRACSAPRQPVLNPNLKFSKIVNFCPEIWSKFSTKI